MKTYPIGLVPGPVSVPRDSRGSIPSILEKPWMFCRKF